MGNRCEWKNGGFVPCKKCTPAVRQTFNMGVREYDVECAECGYSISKPEPVIKIVKSGDAWVMQDIERNDRIYTGIYQKTKEEVLHHYYLEIGSKLDHTDLDFWTKISEIKITDEIAKLRPYIIHKVTPNELDILYGVYEDHAIILSSGEEEANSDYMLSSFRLATVDDLERISDETN